MRILHVIGSLKNGGAEAVLYRLATYPSDVQHLVVSFASPDWYSPLFAEHGIQVRYLNVESWIRRLSAMGRLRRIMRSFDPDVVQCWMYRANFVGGMVAKTAGFPVSWGIHCSSLDPLGMRARGWAYACGAVARWIPDCVINCSVRSAELHKRIGFDRAPMEIVHNGYDTDVFFPDSAARARIRAELNVSEDIFVLGTVARWHAQKDHPNLIAALKILNERGITNWRCLFVGPDMDLENRKLLAELKSASVTDQVRCVGPRHDIPDVMRALDLHVLPSAGSEAFPNVVAEAMSSETPCIVTDVGDSAYMVGRTGWVVPPKSPEQLADKIAEALDEWETSRASWLARGRSARQRVLEKFTLAPMVERYMKIWRDIAARDGADQLETKVVADFGAEWEAFDQSALAADEHKRIFNAYFSNFPFDELRDAEGFDLGCGSGRWAALVAPHVGKLHCIEPAPKALAVARSRLSHLPNVEYHLAGAGNIPMPDESQGFGYCLGVLHHIRDTEAAMRSCVRKLKPGAPFLVYLYYDFDNRPVWYRLIWKLADLGRNQISRLPFRAKKAITDVIAACVYYPFARAARLIENLGANVETFPLSAYRSYSFYTMRTDALDRFGTRLEQRFTREQIETLMTRCGLTEIVFREDVPYWVACGRKSPDRGKAAALREDSILPDAENDHHFGRHIDQATSSV